jgi:exportin-2 (importin alpha re-exporter)
VAGSPATLPIFERTLFGPFTIILQQDIDRMWFFRLESSHFDGGMDVEYVPYVFQVLAQMLELHKGGQVLPEYWSILPLLLTPAVWQQKGSIPGLVRLLTAFLAQDSTSMVAAGQIAPVLAVAQQRLIPSKVNDAWGIELLQAVVRYVKP